MTDLLHLTCYEGWRFNLCLEHKDKGIICYASTQFPFGAALQLCCTLCCPTGLRFQWDVLTTIINPFTEHCYSLNKHNELPPPPPTLFFLNSCIDFVSRTSCLMLKNQVRWLTSLTTAYCNFLLKQISHVLSVMSFAAESKKMKYINRPAQPILNSKCIQRVWGVSTLCLHVQADKYSSDAQQLLFWIHLCKWVLSSVTNICEDHPYTFHSMPVKQVKTDLHPSSQNPGQQNTRTDPVFLSHSLCQISHLLVGFSHFLSNFQHHPGALFCLLHVSSLCC